MPKINFANENCIKMIAEFEHDNFNDEGYSYDTLLNMLKDNYLLKDNDNIFVILSEEELIGYVIFHISNDFTDILKIFIREHDRNKGYASAFIEYIYNLAKRYRSKKLMVEVRSKNFSAIKFYENNKFYKISERKSYYKNPNDDAYIYERLVEV